MTKEKREPTEDELEERFGLTEAEYDAIEGNNVHEKAANFVRMIMSPKDDVTERRTNMKTLKTISVILPMTLLLACGGGGGYSGSSPEPTAQLKSASVPALVEETTNEPKEDLDQEISKLKKEIEDLTPPTYTPEETKERAQKKVEEIIRSRQPTREQQIMRDINKYVYRRDHARSRLQEYINGAHDINDDGKLTDADKVNPECLANSCVVNNRPVNDHIKRLKQKIVESRENIVRLYGELGQPVPEEPSVFPYVDDFAHKRPPLPRYTYKGFGAWLGQAELENYPYKSIDHNGFSDWHGLLHSREKSRPPEAFFYTGRYAGHRQRDDLTFEGDMTAQVTDTLDGVDFIFKDLNLLMMTIVVECVLVGMI